MKVIVSLLAVPLLSISAQAQDTPLSIAFSAQERQAIINMCNAATWASRIQYDGMCEALKARFADADTKAKAAVVSPTSVPAAPGTVPAQH